MAPSEALKPGSDEQLARRMFYGGCCLLPWLWLCNAIHFRSHLADPRANPEVSRWVHRSAVGASVAVLAYVTWVLVFQLHWRSWSWAPGIMFFIPSEDLTGW